MSTRERTLKDMLQRIIDRDDVHVEECDDCHTDDAIVTVDPDTYYQGEYVLCEQCIKQRLAIIRRKKARRK